MHFGDAHSLPHHGLVIAAIHLGAIEQGSLGFPRWNLVQLVSTLPRVLPLLASGTDEFLPEREEQRPSVVVRLVHEETEEIELVHESGDHDHDGALHLEERHDNHKKDCRWHVGSLVDHHEICTDTTKGVLGGETNQNITSLTFSARQRWFGQSVLAILAQGAC